MAGLVGWLAVGLATGFVGLDRPQWENSAHLPFPHRAVHDDLVFRLKGGLAAGLMAADAGTRYGFGGTTWAAAVAAGEVLPMGVLCRAAASRRRGRLTRQQE